MESHLAVTGRIARLGLLQPQRQLTRRQQHLRQRQWPHREHDP
jgi:hypothetical protein